MKTKSDIGFIVKIKQFPNADKLIIIVTKNQGTIKTVAKGVGKSSSKRVSSLDLLNKIKFTYYETKSIDLLNEVLLVNDFQDIKQDKSVINHLLYVLELIEKLLSDDDLEINLYPILEDLLDLISSHKDNFFQLISSFELKLLDIAGYTPNLISYIKDGKLIKQGDKRIISIGAQLGYNQTQGKLNLVSDNILKIQKFFIENPLKDSLKLKIDEDSQKSLNYINRHWIESTIEQRLKSTTLIN